MHEWGALFHDFYDMMLGAWVLSPSYPKYDLASVMKRAELEENAAGLFELSERQRDEIERMELENVMYEIEEPLLRVLYAMEEEGFRVSGEELARLGEKYDKEISGLTAKIF